MIPEWKFLSLRTRNHFAWIGALVSVTGLLSYFFVFARFPFLRGTAWLNLLLVEHDPPRRLGARSVEPQRHCRDPQGRHRVYDSTVTMLVFTALAAVSVAFAIGLKLTDRGPDSHSLELPSADADALNEAKRAEA